MGVGLEPHQRAVGGRAVDADEHPASEVTHGQELLGPAPMRVVRVGREHHRQRKLLMPSFHGERMEAYGQTMLELADSAIDAWPMNKVLMSPPATAPMAAQAG